MRQLTGTPCNLNPCGDGIITISVVQIGVLWLCFVSIEASLFCFHGSCHASVRKYLAPSVALLLSIIHPHYYGEGWTIRDNISKATDQHSPFFGNGIAELKLPTSPAFLAKTALTTR